MGLYSSTTDLHQNQSTYDKIKGLVSELSDKKPNEIEGFINEMADKYV